MWHVYLYFSFLFFSTKAQICFTQGLKVSLLKLKLFFFLLAMCSVKKREITLHDVCLTKSMR